MKRHSYCAILAATAVFNFGSAAPMNQAASGEPAAAPQPAAGRAQPGMRWLPAYNRIEEPAFETDLRLTSAQKDRLERVARGVCAELQKYVDGLEKPPYADVTEYTHRIDTKKRQLKAAAQPQVEKILTAAQLDAYKKLALPGIAWDALRDPEVLRGRRGPRAGPPP